MICMNATNTLLEAAGMTDKLTLKELSRYELGLLRTLYTETPFFIRTMKLLCVVRKG